MAYTHTSSYSVEIRNAHKVLKRTLDIYRAAINYLLTPVMDHWVDIEKISGSNEKLSFVEAIVHTTKDHVSLYDFDRRFYKFPSYMRRSAIHAAIGAVSSYQSNHKNWVDNGCVGAEPKMSMNRHLCPALYKGNMFKLNSDGSALVKVYRHNDWVWEKLRLRKTDVDYLKRRTVTADTVFSPVLEKRKQGKYFLRFAMTEKIEFLDKPVFERKVCAVDLGVNTDATCSVIDVHGTVLARKFITRAREKDSVYRALHRVSVFQRLHGSHDSGRLWSLASRRNLNLAHMVAHDIVDFAREHGCDVIVFEHLGTRGKKRGSKKQRLHMWKHRDIQKTAESLAHKYGIRISRVCAWNTSRLAYDGSGTVKRGKAVSDTTPYDVCVFKTGKTYNCDLSASYNIGARYFIRELMNESPDIMAKVPDIGSGTRRVLADLWHINAVVKL